LHTTTHQAHSAFRHDGENRRDRTNSHSRMRPDKQRPPRPSALQQFSPPPLPGRSLAEWSGFGVQGSVVIADKPSHAVRQVYEADRDQDRRRKVFVMHRRPWRVQAELDDDRRGSLRRWLGRTSWSMMLKSINSQQLLQLIAPSFIAVFTLIDNLD